MLNIVNYNVKEIANMFKVSEQLVRKMIKQGKIKATKIGREYRVSEEDVNKILNNN